MQCTRRNVSGIMPLNQKWGNLSPSMFWGYGNAKVRRQLFTSLYYYSNHLMVRLGLSLMSVWNFRFVNEMTGSWTCSACATRPVDILYVVIRPHVWYCISFSVKMFNMCTLLTFCSKMNHVATCMHCVNLRKKTLQ